jgi:uncharacterized membrane protein
MDWPSTVLRVVHILSGVVWAGSAFFMVVFLEPAVAATGSEGAKVMGELMNKKLSLAMAVAALFTTAAGAALFWKDSGGLQVSWMTAGEGLGLTVGAAAGIAAFILGLAVQVPTTGRIAALGREIRAAGAPPSPAQAGEMHGLQERMAVAGRWGLVLMAVSVLFMALAAALK